MQISYRPRRDSLPRKESQTAFAPERSPASALRWISERLDEDASEIFRGTILYQPPGSPVLDYLGHCPRFRPDARQAGEHRFYKRDPKRLVPRRHAEY